MKGKRQNEQVQQERINPPILEVGIYALRKGENFLMGFDLGCDDARRREMNGINECKERQG